MAPGDRLLEETVAYATASLRSTDQRRWCFWSTSSAGLSPKVWLRIRHRRVLPYESDWTSGVQAPRSSVRHPSYDAWHDRTSSVQRL